MKALSFRTRALIAVTGITTVLAVAPSASAYWRAPGAGAGSATAATVDMTAQSFTATGLYPGASRAVTVDVRVSSPVAVQLVAVTAGTVAVSAGAAPCSGAAVSFVVTTPLPLTVPAGAVTLQGTVAMASGAENGCQGRTFTIPLTVTGQI